MSRQPTVRPKNGPQPGTAEGTPPQTVPPLRVNALASSSSPATSPGATANYAAALGLTGVDGGGSTPSSTATTLSADTSSLDTLNARIDGLTTQFDQASTRHNELVIRLDGLAQRTADWEETNEYLRTQQNARLDAMDARMDSNFNQSQSNFNELKAMIQALSLKNNSSRSSQSPTPKATPSQKSIPPTTPTSPTPVPDMDRPVRTVRPESLAFTPVTPIPVYASRRPEPRVDEPATRGRLSAGLPSTSQRTSFVDTSRRDDTRRRGSGLTARFEDERPDGDPPSSSSTSSRPDPDDPDEPEPPDSPYGEDSTRKHRFQSPTASESSLQFAQRIGRDGHWAYSSGLPGETSDERKHRMKIRSLTSTSYRFARTFPSRSIPPNDSMERAQQYEGFHTPPTALSEIRDEYEGKPSILATSYRRESILPEPVRA